MPSVLQDWVQTLGLRHQGTLLTAVRGCDTAMKDEPSKLLIRCFRATILNAHCKDPRKAATFIQQVDEPELRKRFDDFRKTSEQYPAHYLGHLLHAIQIVGYKHPEHNVRALWEGFYLRMVQAQHLNPETEAQMDDRLNADEATFAARDHTCDGALIDWRAASRPGV
jgi:3-phenylpropionate/cinnamic acid dioxygenase small subunit